MTLPVSTNPPLNLVAVSPNSLAIVDHISAALGIPREAFADGEAVEAALSQLPRQLQRMPAHLRTAPVARMCAAVSMGLFDAAVNYAWNQAISALRDKVRQFGFDNMSSIRAQDFDEGRLRSLTEAELLKLSLEISIITEEGHFFLDQCREIRNDYSSAHPSDGMVDDTQLIAFINNCVKYAVEPQAVPLGINNKKLLDAIKGTPLNQGQAATLVAELRNGIEIQRNAAFVMMHGIYCDETTGQQARLNDIQLATGSVGVLSGQGRSKLIDQHQEYVKSGNEAKTRASRDFFEKLHLTQYLPQSERHYIVTRACELLVRTHEAWNNFYNEPPFAERLLEIFSQAGAPDSAKEVLVRSALYVGIGNRYNVSTAAFPYYKGLVRRFSPMEVKIFLDLVGSDPQISYKIKSYQSCRNAFCRLLAEIDPTTVPSSSQARFDELRKLCGMALTSTGGTL